MPNASLVKACTSLFSDHASVGPKLKTLLLENECGKAADQTKVAELRVALDLLHACMVSSASGGNRRRLEQAEDICMLLIQRPSNSPIAAGFHARARFALAIINLERSEPEVCAINIAHAFAIDPRWSRKMFPEIFESVFRPLCASTYEQLERDEAKAQGRTYYFPIIATRAGAVVVGAGVAAGIVAAAFGIAAATGGRNLNQAVVLLARESMKQTAGPIWRSANDENARAAQIARIQERHEERLDKMCQGLALEFL